MLRHQLMPRDVDQQVLFLEVLADAARHAGQEADGGGGDGDLGDEDAGVVVLFVDEVVELADLLGADARGVGAEFDEDGAAVGLGLGVGFGWAGGVFGEH